MIYLMGDPCKITRLVKPLVQKQRKTKNGVKIWFEMPIVTVQFEDGSTLDTESVNLRADDGINEINAAIEAVKDRPEELG